MSRDDTRRVTRCLFGPVDHDLLQQELSRGLEQMYDEARRRWNFDFVTETPLPDSPTSRYEWFKEPSDTVGGGTLDPMRDVTDVTTGESDVMSEIVTTIAYDQSMESGDIVTSDVCDIESESLLCDRVMTNTNEFQSVARDVGLSREFDIVNDVVESNITRQCTNDAISDFGSLNFTFNMSPCGISQPTCMPMPMQTGLPDQSFTYCPDNGSNKRKYDNRGSFSNSDIFTISEQHKLPHKLFRNISDTTTRENIEIAPKLTRKSKSFDSHRTSRPTFSGVLDNRRSRQTLVTDFAPIVKRAKLLHDITNETARSISRVKSDSQ